MKLDTSLVVYNKPLYQLHILEQKDPHYLRLFKTKHPTTLNWKRVYEQHSETLEGVMRILKLLGIKTDSIYRRRLKKIRNYDLVITVGGDGTFLETSHFILNSQVLLGVNAAPFESTGALCRARLDNFLSVIIDLITGKRHPKIMTRLQIKRDNKTLPYPVLNEILFANQSPAGTSRYIIQLNQKQEEHKSSGIWIASATGSTAAIHSAGGVPLKHSHTGMQFGVREIFPEKGKKFKIIRGILPKNKKLTVFSKMRQGAIFIDGNRLVIPIAYGEKIELSSNGKPLRAIL